MSVEINELVNRFLTWPVPADVHPDGSPGQPGRTGTNLLTAPQAKQMLEHVLGDVLAEAAKSERRAVVFGDIVHNQVIAMRAAVVAAKLEGLDVGMQWIANTLEGPGHLPDLEEAKALGGAQALFDKEVAEHEAFRAAHPIEPVASEAVALCACKDRPTSQCPGEWEPGCDLGANKAHAVVVRSDVTAKAQPVAVPAGVPMQAPLDHCRPSGIAYDLPPLRFTAAQLREALDFFGGDEGDADDPVTVSIALRDEGKDIDGEPRPRGLYVWMTDYPEEGAMLLDGKTPPWLPVAVPDWWPTGAVPAGWKLVPVEPTEAMAREAQARIGNWTTHWYMEMWRAMVAVSPAAPAQVPPPLTIEQIAKALADAGLKAEDYREDGLIEPLVRAVEHAHRIGA